MSIRCEADNNILVILMIFQSFFFFTISLALLVACSKNNRSSNVNKVVSGQNADISIEGIVSEPDDADSGNSEEALGDEKSSPDRDPDSKSEENQETDEKEETETEEKPKENSAALDGAKLYQKYCEECHNPLENSSKKGASVGRTKQALIYEPMKSGVGNISDEELALIAKALEVDDALQLDVKSLVTFKDYDLTITMDQVNTWVENHQLSLQAADRADYKYLYISDVIYKNPMHRNLARVCASRTVNSIATSNPEIVNLQEASEGHGIVFAIRLSDYFPENAQEKWNTIAGNRNLNLLPVERFAYNTHHYSNYGDLIDHPANDVGDHFVTLGIQEQQPGIRLAMQEAITYGARYAEAYRYQVTDRFGTTHERTYWRSGDPVYAVDTDSPEGYARFKTQCFLKRDEERPVPTKNSKGAQELVWDKDGGSVPRLRFDRLPTGPDTHPDVCAGGSATASEAWRNLPNGLIAFYLWGNANQRINRAATTLVTDPLERQETIVTIDNQSFDVKPLGVGQCYYCHISGTMYRKSDMATAKANGLLTNVEANNFWSDQAVIDEFYQRDSDLFREAIRKIVVGMSDDEQLNKSLTAFELEEPCYTITNYHFDP